MIHTVTPLSNGLRVVTAELPHTRSATISIYVGAGSRYERDDQAGLSHFLEHMLFKGASRKATAREISEAIESVGGTHNAATDREVTVYYAKVPHTATLDVLDTLCDMVRAPIMDALELEKERHVILEELAGIEDSPEEIAGILSDETLWPAQPLGRNIGGTPHSVRALSLDAVREYFAAQHVPSNMVVSVAGNIHSAAVVDAVERWLGDMHDTAAGAWYPAAERNGYPRVAVRTKDTEQAHICLGFPTVPLGHPDRYAIDLLSTILGEGMSSRLFLELREERALVYDVHSYPSEYRDAGSLTVYAGCDPEHARITAEAALCEIEAALRDVDKAELAKARGMARGRIQLRMEDTRAVAGWQGSQELLLNEVLSVDQVVEKLNAVDIDDLRRAGQHFLQPSRAILAAVGPFDAGAFDGLI
jgi:predicted Zn-dependent peptidase